MGATSVTGVGAGSAESVSKGAAGRQTLGVGHLIGPHIVAAGKVALNGSGAAVVTVPVTGVTADFMLLLGNQTDGTAMNGTVAVSGSTATLTFAGSGSDVVGYALVKVGVS